MAEEQGQGHNGKLCKGTWRECVALDPNIAADFSMEVYCTTGTAVQAPS